MTAEQDANRGQSPERPPRKGLPIGRILLPLGTLLGACLLPGALESRQVGWPHLWSWVLGGPLGAAAGMLAALAVLISINAALRMMGRR
jgi:hypothetical protein